MARARPFLPPFESAMSTAPAAAAPTDAAPTAPAATASSTHAQSPALFAPLADLSKRARVGLGALALIANLPLLHYAVVHVAQEMPVSVQVPFQDGFERTELGDNYWSTSGMWRIEGGKVHSPGVKNNPAWLKAKLPQDVAIEFTLTPLSPEGDVKFEAFGDGLNHSSGYVFILGGWGNNISIIARLNEHGSAFGADGVGMAGNAPEQVGVSGRTLNELQNNGFFNPESGWRVERRDVKAQPGRAYRMRVERKGGTLSWFIDETLFLRIEDRWPLAGRGHDRFGMSGWETDALFDDLSIKPL